MGQKNQITNRATVLGLKEFAEDTEVIYARRNSKKKGVTNKMLALTTTGEFRVYADKEMVLETKSTEIAVSRYNSIN